MVCEVNPTLIKRLQKDFKQTKLIVNHYSVITEFESMKSEVNTMVFNDKVQTSIDVLKEVCNSETKQHCRHLLKELDNSFKDISETAKQFEQRLFAFKDYWLPYKFTGTYTAGLHSYTKLAVIKEIFDNAAGKAPITLNTC